MIKDLIPDSVPYYRDQYKVGGYNRNGRLFYAMISWRNYHGSMEEIMGAGDNPITLSTSYADKDFFDPIAGTKCKIKVQAEEYDQFLRLARGDDSMFGVRVVEKDSANNDIVLFRGFLRPETYEQEYGYHKPVVTFEATDGLGLLRDIPFRPEAIPTRGAEPLHEIISYLLNLAGNYYDWYDLVNYESAIIQENKNVYGSFEHQIFDWFDKPCHDVLIDILNMFDAQILSVDGNYYIRLIDEPEAPYYDKYDYKGNLVETGGRTATTKQLYNDFSGASGQVSMDRPVRKSVVTQTKSPVENLIYNHNFDKGKDGWESTLSFSVSEGVATLSYPDSNNEYIKQNFNRGIQPGTPVKLRIKIRARYRGPGSTWKLKVSHANLTRESQEFVYRDEDDKIIGGWEDIEVWYTTAGYEKMFHLDTLGEPDIKIYGIHSAKVDISSVEVRALDWENEEPFETVDTRKETEINKYSLSDEIHDLNYTAGDPHVYNNALNIINSTLFHNRTDQKVHYFDLMRQRRDNYHRNEKIRLNITVYTCDELLNGLMILFDEHLSRDFLITSMSYDLRVSSYSLELLSFRKSSLLEHMTWILADGYWNDDGYWMDGENWNDGTTTYDVTFVAVDGLGNPVNDYLVNICCPSNTKGSGQNNEVTFVGRQIDTYTYTAFKDGYQEVTGTFEIVNQNLTINITLDELE